MQCAICIVICFLASQISKSTKREFFSHCTFHENMVMADPENISKTDIDRRFLTLACRYSS